MTETAEWAQLRQVVLATTDHAGDVAAVRSAFGLGAGIADPEVAHMHLVDATMAVSDQTYLEFVAPLDERASVSGWLTKIGGRGGYALSVQHCDPGAVKERAEAAGVRVVADVVVFGHRVVQLHPRDVGVLLELDGIADRDVWFWDDIDPGPEAGAAVAEIVEVRVPVADPRKTTVLWHELLGLGEPGAADEIQLGRTRITFAPGGPSADWTVVLRAAEGHDDVALPALPGVHFEVI